MRKAEDKSVVMPVVAALQVLADLCHHDQIVVTNQGSARIWPKLRQRPLDFHYNPSTMGGLVPLALGLALGQPQRDVLAISGDGSLLMSLGSLVTVVGSRATNLTVVLLDNGIYEVTGGQETPAARSAVDYAGLARAAGFPSTAEFRDLADWQARAWDFFALPGPRFIRLAVSTAPPEYLASGTPPLAEQLAGLQQALGVSDTMNESQPIRLGFVGAGGICEQRHLPNLAKMSDVELVAVCNRSPESSRRVQEKWGFARTADDCRQIVEANDVDAVFIGTWPYLHCELSLAALAAGKHVFCQARMCMDWVEARQMVAAASAHPRQVAMVCPSPFRVRWERTVRELLASERFGRLLSVAVISTSAANRDPHQVSWRERRELSGLNILQVGIYTETLNAWCGDYLSLAATASIPLNKHDAQGRKIEIQIPQTVSITGTLAGGIPCTEFHTGLAAGYERAEILLCGSDATCRVDLMTQQVWLHPESSRSMTGDLIDAVGDEWQVEAEFLAAIRSARRGEPWPVRPNFSEAARYMRKLQAIHDSARESRLVSLLDYSG